MASVIEGLLLASASPTRARLLADAGLAIRVEPAAVDERAIKETLRAAGCGAAEGALRLAEAKARRVAEGHDRAAVIGADQILVCDNRWFDKPMDLAEARVQLQDLRGKTHELATAVCVVRDAARVWHSVCRPRLRMREFTDAFLDDYLAAEGAQILGSVGAYRLEGRGAQLFDDVEGDHFAILGLPLFELLAFLRGCGTIPS
ncbi:MAG: Maf-like protein [Alphaproteobacteria bacterium]|nr:Maf-like protein [Alphaproteobacteria bacterium]